MSGLSDASLQSLCKTAQIGIRLTLRSFEHENRKVSIDITSKRVNRYCIVIVADMSRYSCSNTDLQNETCSSTDNTNCK